MFTVELYAGIRRAVMVDGLSRREAAKRFDVHRNTISKMLQFSVPPGYRRRERAAAKKLGPYMAWIDTRQARRCLWKTQGSLLAGEMERRLVCGGAGSDGRRSITSANDVSAANDEPLRHLARQRP